MNLKLNRFLWLIAFFSCLATSVHAKKIRALFIGNSYTEVNNLPQIIAMLAADGGDTLEFQKSTPGGFRLEQHASHPPTLSLIESGNWDYVILQEQSQIPSFTDWDVESFFYPYVKTLDSLIHVHNPCATTMMYITWGRKNGDADNCPYFPPLCTYLGMDSLLRLRYETVAEQIGASLSPAGPVWRYIRSEYPGIELYTADQSHPTAAGSFAAACAFYSVMFGKNPADRAYNYSLPAVQAHNIRQAAKIVTYDSLDYWTRFVQLPKALFEFSISESTVTFYNQSENADSYIWNFGDDTPIDTTANPIHTFTSPGSYTVTLTAIHCNYSHEWSTDINIGTSGVEEISPLPAIKIYPNPVKQELKIEHLGSARKIELYNLLGQKLSSVSAHGESISTLDVTSLNSGFYFLRVYTNQGVSTFKVTKQ